MDINAIPPTHFLILGPAGSGITSAMGHFGEFGFVQIVDALPETVPNLLQSLTAEHSHLAISLNSTPENQEAIKTLLAQLAEIKQQIPTLNVLYLDAPDTVLTQRYLDSGKPHPYETLSKGDFGLTQAVASEREVFFAVKLLKKQFPNGYYAIDTSTHNLDELRAKVAKILSIPVEAAPMTVCIQSFGFKYGLPPDSELVFDMRFVPNPYYEDALRPLTGLDKPVQDFIFDQAIMKSFTENWKALMSDMLPAYHKEGRLRVRIAVGCTGGQHRSVCMAETLAAYLRDVFPHYTVLIGHREQDHWPKQSAQCQVTNTQAAPHAAEPPTVLSH